MTWLLLFLLVPVIVIAYLLVAPFFLEMDSTKNIVRIRFHRLASAQILEGNSSLIIEIKFIFWSKQVDLLALKGRTRKPVREKARKKMAGNITFRKVKEIIKSFKINKCYVNLDFGDVVLNAELVPVFYGLKRITGKTFSINFTGENEIKLEIENNMARICWAYLFK